MKHTPLLFTIFYTLIGSAQAQVNKNSPLEHRHKFTLVLAHAHVSKGINPGTSKQHWLILPAWCLDYDYLINPKWQIGLHTDLVTETYKVESHDNTVIERTRPFSATAVGGYRFAKRWTFLTGLGGEFAQEHNFFLTTFGTEYDYELPDGFEIMGMVSYDIKWDAYDTFFLGLGISKKLK